MLFFVPIHYVTQHSQRTTNLGVVRAVRSIGEGVGSGEMEPSSFIQG